MLKTNASDMSENIWYEAGHLELKNGPPSRINWYLDEITLPIQLTVIISQHIIYLPIYGGWEWTLTDCTAKYIVSL